MDQRTSAIPQGRQCTGELLRFPDPYQRCAGVRLKRPDPYRQSMAARTTDRRRLVIHRDNRRRHTNRVRPQQHSVRHRSRTCGTTSRSRSSRIHIDYLGRLTEQRHCAGSVAARSRPDLSQRSPPKSHQPSVAQPGTAARQLQRPEDSSRANTTP